MEIFEIHITGDESILENGKKLSLKTISVDLLDPNKNVIRTEHMTSQVLKFENFKDCKSSVENMVLKLKQLNTKIIRVKIESCYYEHYVDISKYIESHFITENCQYPISRNVRKTEILGTDREYNKSNYDKFVQKWNKEIVELCLYDSFIEEDSDWLGLWQK